MEGRPNGGSPLRPPKNAHPSRHRPDPPTRHVGPRCHRRCRSGGASPPPAIVPTLATASGTASSTSLAVAVAAAAAAVTTAAAAASL